MTTDRAGDNTSPPERSDLEAVEALDRRRRQLWFVGAVVLLAVAIAVTLSFSGNDLLADLFDRVPILRWSFLIVTAVFIVYGVDQERQLSRANQDLVGGARQAVVLSERVEDLEALLHAARTVNSVLAPEDVFHVLLDAALEVARADAGAVRLRVGDRLTVAVSQGDDAPTPGTTSGLDVTPTVARAVERAEPSLGERGDSAAAPLIVKGRVVGVLEIRRDQGGAFTEADVKSVMLFAEHGAAAVANANRFEQERSRVEALVDAAEQRSEFVARTVHDLRSPLQAIGGYVNLLQDERLSPEQRQEALTAVEAQLERLNHMVEEVLRAASAEAGADLHREPLDLLHVLGRARDLVVKVSAAQEPEPRPIRLHALATMPSVYGDPEALHHVFVNLVENAVKYSPSGSPIDVSVEAGEGEVVVSVTDHGKGIPAEELPHVFERFRRSSAGSGAGVGLGLYIVKALVQAHGGRVWVDSEVNEGSTFHVALPVRRDG